jgi:hypothetical protein
VDDRKSCRNGELSRSCNEHGMAHGARMGERVGIMSSGLATWRG